MIRATRKRGSQNGLPSLERDDSSNFYYD